MSRRKTMLLLAAAAALALIAAGCAHYGGRGMAGGGKMKYFCGCGADCPCRTSADKPGTCACGKPLIRKGVLKEDAANWYICPCGESCGCALKAGDPSKCDCGRDLIAFPKKGKYACACPCECNTVSQQAGNCACGKPMAPVK